jgi:hypothetical protein
MKKITLVLIVVALGIIISSCKNELDSLAPYRESISVYSLIDQNDSVNYVRVNRVFLGEGDANQIAQIQDSVYFKPGEASVHIEKYWNGTKKQTYVFSETYEKPLGAGSFNVNQLIYKSSQKFRSDSVGKYFEYKLVVKNNTTGKVFNSKNIKLIKDVSPTSPSGALCTSAIGANCFFSQTNIGILSSATAKTKLLFSAPVNSAMCGVKFKFYYHSVYLDNSTANKVITMDQGIQKLEAVSTGQTVDFTFGGQQFYKTLSSSTPAETNLKERVGDSLNFYFTFGGEEYKFYQEINNTSGSFGQEKPIYTNMLDDAIGVFSSRTKVTVSKKLWDYTGGPLQTNVLSLQTLNELISSTITCHLRLRGPNWPMNSGC